MAPGESTVQFHVCSTHHTLSSSPSSAASCSSFLHQFFVMSFHHFPCVPPIPGPPPPYLLASRQQSVYPEFLSSLTHAPLWTCHGLHSLRVSSIHSLAPLPAPWHLFTGSGTRDTEIKAVSVFEPTAVSLETKPKVHF